MHDESETELALKGAPDERSGTAVSGAGLSRFYLPPVHRIFADFFAESVVGRLLEYTISEEARFEPTRISAPERIDPDIRRSMKLKSLGPLENEIREKMMPLTGELIAALGVTPFDLFLLELELVAHGDGAFYSRHVDTMTGDVSLDKGSERMLSAVYYFNANPKGFSGGALRLYSFAPVPGGEHGFVDIDAERNTLVVFPSWAPHEVRPVSSPSGRFMDSRFAINCWFRRKTSERRKQP